MALVTTTHPVRLSQLVLSVVLLLLAACAAPTGNNPTATPARPSSLVTRSSSLVTPAAPPSGDRAEVTYVFDGDTIEVELDGPLGGRSGVELVRQQ